jgi:hypothetical protein
MRNIANLLARSAPGKKIAVRAAIGAGSADRGPALAESLLLSAPARPGSCFRSELSVARQDRPERNIRAVSLIIAYSDSAALSPRPPCC